MPQADNYREEKPYDKEMMELMEEFKKAFGPPLSLREKRMIRETIVFREPIVEVGVTPR